MCIMCNRIFSEAIRILVNFSVWFIQSQRMHQFYCFVSHQSIKTKIGRKKKFTNSSINLKYLGINSNKDSHELCIEDPQKQRDIPYWWILHIILLCMLWFISHTYIESHACTRWINKMYMHVYVCVCKIYILLILFLWRTLIHLLSLLLSHPH